MSMIPWSTQPGNGGGVADMHVVLTSDSDGPGGSSVLSDPSLGRRPDVEIISGSDRDQDDFY